MKEQHSSLITGDLQFGFKESSLTIFCRQLLIETIEYYNNNNTCCFMLVLDASKGFDRIEYVRLFTLLRLRNMCTLVLRLLINIFLSQRMQVRFGTAMSSHFSISYGVKQGGIYLHFYSPFTLIICLYSSRNLILVAKLATHL